jgi:hypothetical protein
MFCVYMRGKQPNLRRVYENMVRPIQGSQVIPPIPNNVQAECICVPKVYDFVVFTEDINSTVPLPAIPPVGCPTTVTDIECTLITETFFPISCETNGVCTVLDRRPINIDGVNAALVKLRQDIPVDVTLTGTDAVGAPATCTIRVLVPFIRQVVLCFPPEFTTDNLICRIISGDCTVTTPPPIGGIPFPASVGLELFVCKEVQVLAAVKLEVLAKFCSPRPPITPPVTSICPPITFPQQCDFFPEPNCLCESAINDSCDLAGSITCTLIENGVASTGGTQTLVATVCNSCAPFNTSITYNHTNPTVPAENFTFTATTFDTEACTVNGAGAITQVVSGTGTVVSSSGTGLATYTLTAVEAATDSWSLVLIGIAPFVFTATATNATVLDANLVINQCTQFPT